MQFCPNNVALPSRNAIHYYNLPIMQFIIYGDFNKPAMMKSCKEKRSAKDMYTPPEEKIVVNETTCENVN